MTSATSSKEVIAGGSSATARGEQRIKQTGVSPIGGAAGTTTSYYKYNS